MMMMILIKFLVHKCNGSAIASYNIKQSKENKTSCGVSTQNNMSSVK